MKVGNKLISNFVVVDFVVTCSGIADILDGSLGKLIVMQGSRERCPRLST